MVARSTSDCIVWSDCSCDTVTREEAALISTDIVEVSQFALTFAQHGFLIADTFRAMDG